MKRPIKITLAIVVGVPMSLCLGWLSLKWFVSNTFFLNRF